MVSGSSALNMAEPAVAVLEELTTLLGLPFDYAKGLDVWRRTQATEPISLHENWEARVTQAAESFGIYCLPLSLSPREAITQAGPQTPLIGYVTNGNGGMWIVLTGRSGAKARLFQPGKSERLASAAELAQLQQVDSEKQRCVWLMAQAALPAEYDTRPHDVTDPDEGHQHEPISPFRRLLRLLQPERRDLWAIMLFAIGIGFLNLVIPIAVEEVVNTVARGSYIQPLVLMSFIMATCLTMAATLHCFQHLLVEYLRRRLFVRVVADLAYRLPRVKQFAFDRQDGPELVNRFFDVLTLKKAVATLLLDGLSVIIGTAIGLMVLAFYHPWLLVFDVVLVTLIVAIVFGLGIGAVQASIKESINKYRVAFWLQGLVLHPRAFKLAGGPALAWQHADTLARDYILARRAKFRILFRQIVFGLILQVVASVTLLGLGGWLVIHRQLTLGQLVAAEVIVTLLVASFVKLGKSLEVYYDLMAAVDKLGHLVDLPLERTGGEQLPDVNVGVSPTARRGATVRMQDVGFGYHGSRRVLDHLNFEIRAGERLALVGGSASGKSTLMELLYGMREPQTGIVAIDGVDMKTLDLDSVRAHVALVQGIEIFDGNVLQNVLLGREHLSAADARKALEQVGLLDEVLSLPHGLHTYLLNGGRSLSVGHGQLLMLSRAIVGKPRLLLLDETLDTLDADVRWRLLPMLTDRTAPWTLVVITRRPDVVDLCDRALALERDQPGQPARIAERGRGDLHLPKPPRGTP